MRASTGNAGPSRRRYLTAILAAVIAVLALLPTSASAAALPAVPFDDAGYWAVADRTQERLESLWRESLGRYVPGSPVDSQVNGELLLAHAAAARLGHEGAARNDHRARLIVRFLVDSNVWVEKAPKGAGDQAHAPGWVSSPGGQAQHMVFEAPVVEGLTQAYLARRELDLSDSTVALIKDRIRRAAQGTYYRWPTIRLNQMNWYIAVYAANATVNGATKTLARDTRNQLRRFVAGIPATATAAGNLGPGLRFHYLPHSQLNHPMNVDSAEYANIVLSFTRFYDQARRAGMAPLPLRENNILRSWARRALTGYWTHGGYMNWDSGFGFERWHQTKKLGLTQQALIGIATAQGLQPSAEYGRWAKWMFDRSLSFYDRTATRAGGLAPALLFDVNVVPQGMPNAWLAAARTEGNAARAIVDGLGSKSASEPPALYSYDPDTGRLAVTTPKYNTAIVAVNQGAFPYGGIELARLYDGDQEVMANIGGRAPASFGVLARAIDGKRLFASQTGRHSVNRSVTPLRLTKAPKGVGATAATHAETSYAGPFTDLRSAGSLRMSGYTAVTRYRFTPDWIEGRWSLTRTTNGRVSIDVLFPSWSGGATVTAELRDGSTVRVGSARIALKDIVTLHVRSERTGYRVTPLERPTGAAVHLLATSRQSSAPRPGSTLAVQIGRGTSAHKFHFAARITPEPAS